MRRKPYLMLPLLTTLALLTAVSPASDALAACTAGNPSASVIETTPTSDFTFNGDGTVTHAKTGLMWKQCAEGQSGAGCATGTATGMAWADALKAANTANAANGGLGFANHTDWRLPNQNELESIIESCGYSPSINQTAFPATPASGFWSASSYVPSPAYAWYVFFSAGDAGNPPKGFSGYYARLVRAGQSFDTFDGLNPTYGVTYNGNGSTGGSAPVDAAAHAAAATVTVLGNTGSLVKTGYGFADWNTAANGSGTSYAKGHTFAMPSANVTLFAQWRTVSLPDTGQTLCNNGANTMVACTNANTGDAATYPRQDARFGRDAKAAAGTLAKIGGGAAGFDYTKVANNGTDLAADAAQGANPTDWACTRDNVTGLVWEVKTASVTDPRYSGHTYTWYSSDSTTNGGNAGGTGSNTCNGTLPSSQCNTQAFVTAVNAAALCGYTDWRLPTYRELLTLVHRGTQNPSIDTTYFPNTVASNFWSASSYVPSPADAWDVYFSYGAAYASTKASNDYVRLVRGGQF